MGGLGNQLFQIFCGVSYSLRHGVEFRLPDSKSLDFVSRNRQTYWKSFFRRFNSGFEKIHFRKRLFFDQSFGYQFFDSFFH